jgi:hypothetical protein
MDETMRVTMIRKQLLDKDIREKNYNIFFGLVLVLAVSTVIIFILYRLFDAIKAWWMTNKRNQLAKNASLSGRSNPLLDAAFDNEPAADENEQVNYDEYNTISSTIRNKFKAYQTYNQSLKDFYMNALKKDAPDRLDHSSLLPENDNW